MAVTTYLNIAVWPSEQTAACFTRVQAAIPTPAIPTKSESTVS